MLLRSTRIQAGFNQQEAARVMGMNKNQLSAYECGRKIPTKPEVLNAIRITLNLEEGRLLRACEAARAERGARRNLQVAAALRLAAEAAREAE